METPPKATPPKNAPAPQPEELETEGEFSSFFSDIKAGYEKIGTPVVGVLAIAAIIFAGYNLITKNREAALQNAWLDLSLSNSPESLEVFIEDTKNPSVRAVAHLRAGDLLLAESRTADEDDAAAILATAATHYQSALDEAPHLIYELNALDGLGVIAESNYDTAQASELYGQIKTKASGQFPYWVSLAENRLALLPELTQAVVFAPEAVEEASDAADDTEPRESDTAEGAAPATVGGVDLDTPFELAPAEEVDTPDTPEAPADTAE